MGRDLQKRKRRSSRNAIRQPSSTKSKRLLNPLGNDIVARNWNKKETASQNYRRLGLVSRLKAPTGGVEPSAKSKSTKPVDPFAIAQPTNAVVTEVRVERDENGRIVRVLDGKGKDNPLNDPLNDLDSDDDMDDEEAAEEWEGIDEVEDGTGIFPELESQANRPVAKKVTTQTKREVEWLQRLIEKYGDDTKAMARDRKLNPMQQTAADISRRIKKMKARSA
ncbi:ribosome biogenesis protein Nop16 [Annulohypoxylon stygium]|nr:ribosome biogenesis protein Nop16 [Annulohypoxylon stygium]